MTWSGMTRPPTSQMNKVYFIYEATPRCNSSCLYCYNVWKKDENYPKGELPFLKIKQLFQKVFEEIKPQGITLTGGEPLLRSDIVEVASFFCQQGIKTGIATNGTLLNEELLHRLAAAGIGYFEVSLVAAGQERYKKLSQNESFKKTRQAILSIKKYKIPLTVSFTITKLNLTEISNVIDLCLAFSANGLALNRFIPGGQGLKNLNELSISRQDLEAVLKIASDKAKAYNFPIYITTPIEPCVINHEQYPGLNFGSCSCGKYKWLIDPVGNLRVCEQSPEILGSLFEKSFSELSGSEAVKIFQENNKKPECGACRLSKNCGGGCRFARPGLVL